MMSNAVFFYTTKFCVSEVQKVLQGIQQTLTKHLPCANPSSVCKGRYRKQNKFPAQRRGGERASVG